VLFLGHNQSLILSAKDHPHLKANHAYCTDNSYLYIHGFKNNRRDIGIFNLESNSWDELVTQPRSNWPTPMWITLNLAKMNWRWNELCFEFFYVEILFALSTLQRHIKCFVLLLNDWADKCVILLFPTMLHGCLPVYCFMMLAKFAWMSGKTGLPRIIKKCVLFSNLLFQMTATP